MPSLEDVLKELFDGDEQLISRWLETPVAALAGASPKKLMGTPTGCEVLESYIEKLNDYS
ncbi:MAG: MbcA/ParS/Xre antitoxin family protein [Pseudomonadota bacterium]